jgi:peptide/nickel transport system ATP-binding protein
MKALLHIEDLSVGFNTSVGKVAAVNTVSLEIFPGETLALVGETGCGKSVLASAILKLIPNTATYQGQILYQGRNLLELSEKELASIREQEMSIVLQNPSLALNPLYTIGHQIAEPLRIHQKLKKTPALRLATTLLEKMKFPAPKKQSQMYPFQFSGGMNQRVMIAMSVVLHPKLLIADEPTKGLDRPLQREVLEELELVKTLNHSALLLITHDVKLARTIADRIAIMYAGEILEIAHPHDFFSRPLHPYTQAFLQSLPENGFQPIPGSSPEMTNLPKGCPFHPRCSHKRAICTFKNPEMISFQGRWIKCLLYS